VLHGLRGGPYDEPPTFDREVAIAYQPHTMATQGFADADAGQRAQLSHPIVVREQPLIADFGGIEFAGVTHEFGDLAG
jgi:hypothetical protein